MKKQELRLNQVIEQLNIFAQQNFPVDQVTEFFTTTTVSLLPINEHLFFSPLKYTRHLIYRSLDFELLYMCWSPGQKSPVHGHEGEKCWFRVEQGSLRIVNYTMSDSCVPAQASIDIVQEGY